LIPVWYRDGKRPAQAGLFALKHPRKPPGKLPSKPRDRRVPTSLKIISAAPATFVTIGYYGSAGWWTTNMRAFALGLIFSAMSLPCLAQTVLKSEPLILAPYEIAFVQDASCPVGKVLKVTGAIRGLQRRKACVTLASEQASLATATP
jgi:hypothetical protein